MCDACVMHAVSSRLGRRGMLAAMAAFAALPAATSPAAAQSAIRSTPVARVVDLTHVLHPAFPTFDGSPAIAIEQVLFFAKDGFNINKLTYTEHVGTHFDAPIHFSTNGATVDKLAPEALVCPLFVMDVRQKAANDPDYSATPEDLAAFESAHGKLPAGSCLALNAGWDAHVNSAKFRGPEGGKLHFPGFRPDVAPLLLQRNVAAVAVDTLSMDHGSSPDFAFHLAWLGAGRWGLENAANLGQLPPTGATIVAAPPKIANGTGGPGRAFALL